MMGFRSRVDITVRKDTRTLPQSCRVEELHLSGTIAEEGGPAGMKDSVAGLAGFERGSREGRLNGVGMPVIAMLLRPHARIEHPERVSGGHQDMPAVARRVQSVEARKLGLPHDLQ
ncbi:hypothetical protein D9M72_483120 [compost metagenome]